MNKDTIIQVVDHIINEYDGEPNELQNEPSQNPEDELDRVEDDLGAEGEGDEDESGEGLEDYVANEMSSDMVDSILLDQKGDYHKFFRTMMKKHGVDGIKGMTSEKRSEFFKDVGSQWKNHKNGVKEQDGKFEEYKQFFSYLSEQCGIGDMSILETEDLARFYALVFEAVEVGVFYEAYKDVFKSVMGEFGVSSIKNLPDEKKKAFFNQVDKEWEGKEEKEISSARDKATERLSA